MNFEAVLKYYFYWARNAYFIYYPPPPTQKKLLQITLDSTSENLHQIGELLYLETCWEEELEWGVLCFSNISSQVTSSSSHPSFSFLKLREGEEKPDQINS